MNILKKLKLFVFIITKKKCLKTKQTNIVIFLKILNLPYKKEKLIYNTDLHKNRLLGQS